MTQASQVKGLVILGAGVSGVAAARLACHRHIPVWFWEEKKHQGDLPKDLSQNPLVHWNQTPENLAYLTFMPSPGISESHPLYKRGLRECGNFLSEVDFGWLSLREPTVLVTGTNGKSTVVAGMVYVLKELGVLARALGNIGKPVSEAALEEFSGGVNVVELSSYQLAQSHHITARISVITSLECDHLQRHHTFSSYVKAKWKVVSWAEKNAPLLRESPALICSKQVMEVVEREECGYAHHRLLVPSQVGLEEELSSLIALSVQALLEDQGPQRGITLLELKKLAQGFSGLPYRLQIVKRLKLAEGKSCLFINDAKSTNLAATNYALKRYGDQGKGVVIVGGRLKKAEDLTQLMVDARDVWWVCVGEAAGTFARHLRGLGREVLELTHQRDLWRTPEFKTKAMAGDLSWVLFSPGCESWDQYENFAARGEDFNRGVEEFCAFLQDDLGGI